MPSSLRAANVVTFVSIAWTFVPDVVPAAPPMMPPLPATAPSASAIISRPAAITFASSRAVLSRMSLLAMSAAFPAPALMELSQMSPVLPRASSRTEPPPVEIDELTSCMLIPSGPTPFVVPLPASTYTSPPTVEISAF